MSFKKGDSGNPTGRPKKEKSSTKASVYEAWRSLCSTKPYLIKEAIERGLRGGRPLGFLELGARVMKEIGQQEEQKGTVTIILNSPLQPSALRPMGEVVRVLEVTSHRDPAALPEADLTLLENTDGNRPA